MLLHLHCQVTHAHLVADAANYSRFLQHVLNTPQYHNEPQRVQAHVLPIFVRYLTIGSSPRARMHVVSIESLSSKQEYESSLLHVLHQLLLPSEQQRPLISKPHKSAQSQTLAAVLPVIVIISLFIVHFSYSLQIPIDENTRRRHYPDP